MSRRVVIAVAIVAAAAATAGSLFGRGTAAAPGPTIARVNGAPVSQLDLRVRLSQLLPMASYHGNIEAGKMLRLQRTALDEVVLDELIVQEALATGAVADERKVDAEAAALRARFGSDEEFDEALVASGLTQRAFREYLERAVLVREAQAAHVPPDPSPADVAAYYGRHAAKFVRPEQVRLLELTVGVDPAGGQQAEAKAEARMRSLLRRLDRGADFGQLAWSESSDAYRVKYGDVGWVHRGRLDPDLEAAAFSAPLGKYRTARSLAGWHVFKVVGREPERQLSLEEARATIVERLRRERRESAEREWHRRLQARARVEVLDTALAQAVPVEIPRAPGPVPGTPASTSPMVAAPSH